MLLPTSFAFPNNRHGVNTALAKPCLRLLVGILKTLEVPFTPEVRLRTMQARVTVFSLWIVPDVILLVILLGASCFMLIDGPSLGASIASAQSLPASGRASAAFSGRIVISTVALAFLVADGFVVPSLHLPCLSSEVNVKQP
jgi:hypothetical protein